MAHPNRWGRPEFHATFSSGFCYGMSTRGHWDGPVICNEMGKGIVVQHGKCIKVIAIIDIN